MSELQGFLIGTLTKICPMIRDIHNGMRTDLYRTRASQLDTRLSLLRVFLEFLPRNYDGPSVEQRFGDLFTSLAKICTGKQVQDKTEAWLHLSNGLGRNNNDRLRSSWKKVLSQQDSVPIVQKLVEQSEQLVHLFCPLSVDNMSADVPKDAHTERPHDCTVHFDAGLFALIQQHFTCDPPCQSLAVSQPHHRFQHLSRLCLDSHAADRRERNDGVMFLYLLVSSNDLPRSHWLDVRIKVQRVFQNICGHRAIPPGYFCELLGGPSYACQFLSFQQGPSVATDPPPEPGLYLLEAEQDTSSLYKPGLGFRMSELLKHYDLGAKDKILLAHTVALAYWQLFGSELTQTVWTSDSICFMEQENLRVTKTRAPPLTSCITFDFDTVASNEPALRLIEPAAVHKFQGILSVGIILLEIAFSEPFPSLPRTGTELADARRQIAIARLDELKDKSSDHSQSGLVFTTAVEACVMFNIPGAQDTPNEELLKKARESFYWTVVRPLQHLTTVGFNNPLGGRISPKKQCKRRPMSPNGQGAAFQSGPTHSQSRWLNDLKKVSWYVESRRSAKGLSTPIKVAILDTGCDPSLLPDRAIRRRFEWKDFAEEKNENPQDSHGHGSLMVRLVLECAPNTEIFVARIAKNKKDLCENQSKIAQAICWAGIDCEAHIISMSFGFEEVDHAIRKAIGKVTERRPVILLSSAGNSQWKAESFPASHPSVISVYAANCRGFFSESNARVEMGSKIVLSTFGDDIPQDICQAFKAKTQFRDVCQPGSSISTAVAAGITANMLAYNTLLHKLFPDNMIHTPQMRCMWRTEGMEAVLKGCMARPQANYIQNKFLDPAWFWTEFSQGDDDADDFGRFCAIVTSLGKAYK